MNEQEQDRYEAELRRAPPARLPEHFMARLRTSVQPGPLFSVAQTSKSAVPRGSEPAVRHAAAPTWKSAIAAAPNAFGAALRKLCGSARWLAPATAAAVAVALTVTGLLMARAKLNPGTHAGKKPATPAHGLKADDLHVDHELVSSYDVVAKLPGGEPVRFRCRAWRDQWSVTDTNRGVEIVQDSPRVEVVPVRFETY